MCVLFWHLLMSGQDYAYSMPTATAKKMRAVELKAGASRRRGENPRQQLNREQRREVERRMAEHAQAAYERTVADWHRQQRRRRSTVSART